jgi:Arc/MetJ family transcription regulator
MTVTHIDLDDDALAEAMRLSGAKSKEEAVNLALREYAAHHRRIAALDHYTAVAQDSDLDCSTSSALTNAARQNPDRTSSGTLSTVIT